MEIRKIQGILISSLFIVGLAGCSNSSSWKNADNSPWKSKRDSEVINTEEFVEVSLDEAAEVNSMEEAPVFEEVMAEPEMVAQPELESLSSFDPEPVPVESMSAFERLELEAASPQVEPEIIEVTVAEEVPSARDAGSDIMSASPSDYAVQVYAGRQLGNVNRYISSHGLENMQIVKTDRDGDVIYVLVSLYADRASAKQALVDLEQSTGSTPWIRPVSGLQNIVAQ